jgi:hypothetical protein
MSRREDITRVDIYVPTSLWKMLVLGPTARGLSLRIRLSLRDAIRRRQLSELMRQPPYPRGVPTHRLSVEFLSEDIRALDSALASARNKGIGRSRQAALVALCGRLVQN